MSNKIITRRIIENVGAYVMFDCSTFQYKGKNKFESFGLAKLLITGADKPEYDLYFAYDVPKEDESYGKLYYEWEVKAPREMPELFTRVATCIISNELVYTPEEPQRMINNHLFQRDDEWRRLVQSLERFDGDKDWKDIMIRSEYHRLCEERAGEHNPRCTLIATAKPHKYIK